MSIYEPGFLLFLGAVFLLYMLLPAKYRIYLLLTASCVFYAFAMPEILPAVLIYTGAVYILGNKIYSSGRKKLLYIPTLIFALAFLVVFKYFDTLFGFFGLETGFTIEILGLSYITFQAVAYITDIYKGKTEPCGSIIPFALYLLYFPKILAGPIELPKSFFERIESADPDGKSLTQAGALLVSGYLKVHIVADLLTPAVNAVFAEDAELTGLSAIFGIIIYAFQFFANFSGYTDIARAASGMFGIGLTENFNSPYLASSIKDFWRRWHISLSGWLKYYVYIPLGGNRCSRFRKHLNVLITFTVSGIWHGAGLNFLFWGFAHGMLQILEDMLSPVTEKISSRDRYGIFRVFRTSLTFVTVCLLWTVFNTPTMGDAWHIISAVFTKPGTLSEALDFCGINVITIMLCIAAMAGAKIIARLLSADNRHPRVLFAACLLFGALCASVIVFTRLSAAGINFGIDIGGGVGTGAASGAVNNFNYF